MKDRAHQDAWRSLLHSADRGAVDRPIFFAAATVLGIAVLYLMVLGVAGADIASALPLVVAAIGAGSLALWGWHRDRLAAFGAFEQQTRAELQNRRLRRQLVEMHRAREALADPSDVPTMIVQIATGMLEAEKGMLLLPASDAGGSAPAGRNGHGPDSSAPTAGANGDGPAAPEAGAAKPAWEVVTSVGFSQAAARTETVARVASAALDRDHAFRDDRPPDRRGSDGSEAELEIRNLVAVPIYVKDALCGVVVCANREDGFAEFDDDVLLALGDQAGAVLENGRMQTEMRDSYLAIVRMLAETIKVKDPALHSHSDEVSDYVVTVAQRLRLSGERRERLRFGSLLHDVGKIAISEQILLKPAPLDEEEWREVRMHPLIGSRLLREVSSLAPLADAVLHHHERWDGQGYPDGLVGDAIPLEARIIAVADAFSAMTAERPYRDALTVEDACAELENTAGSCFDPRIVEIFVGEVRRRPPSRSLQPVGAALAQLDATGPGIPRRPTSRPTGSTPV